MAQEKQIRVMGRGLLAAGFALLLLLPVVAWAHCDSLDGPVVADARKALASGDVTPVLKWVRSQDEAEIRAAFQQALAVRALSAQARELADRYFFETLVRVHRMGEGAPYTGLKPAGTEIDPGIRAADTAMETGLVAPLTKHMNEAVSAGIQKRFAALLEKKKHADESIAKGREFVAAYVEFIHFVESLHATAAGAGAESSPQGAHKH
jgi:hypothetical protein